MKINLDIRHRRLAFIRDTEQGASLDAPEGLEMEEGAGFIFKTRKVLTSIIKNSVHNTDKTTRITHFMLVSTGIKLGTAL